LNEIAGGYSPLAISFLFNYQKKEAL